LLGLLIGLLDLCGTSEEDPHHERRSNWWSVGQLFRCEDLRDTSVDFDFIYGSKSVDKQLYFFSQWQMMLVQERKSIFSPSGQREAFPKMNLWILRLT
jgi:hypothetical protein